MAQPALIELQAGGDIRYHLAAWSVWLLAAACSLVYLRNLSWPLLVLSGALLVVLWPGRPRFQPADGKLQIYSDGYANLSGKLCTWSPQARASRWGMVIRLHCEHSEVHALVCASRNQALDYRRLLVWNRFPPFSPMG